MRAAELELLLPDVVRRTAVAGSPTAALLGVAERMHAPVERIVDTFADVVDPLTTPDDFVPMLARWVDLERLDETPAGRVGTERLRLLVHLAAPLSRVRGTRGGLTWLLALATGVGGWDLVETGPFRATLVAPAGAAALVPLAAALVAQEKPAALVIDVGGAS